MSYDAPTPDRRMFGDLFTDRRFLQSLQADPCMDGVDERTEPCAAMASGNARDPLQKLVEEGLQYIDGRILFWSSQQQTR